MDIKRIILIFIIITMLLTNSMVFFADDISIDNTIDESVTLDINQTDIEINDNQIDVIIEDDDFIEQTRFVSDIIVSEKEIDTEDNADEMFYKDDVVDEDLSILDTYEVATDSDALFDITIDDDLISTNSETSVFSESIEDNKVIRNGLIHNKNYGYKKIDYVASKMKTKEDNIFGLPKLPSRYDTREQYNEYGLSIAPPVRDQDPYGTCWAFSTINMFEASIRSQGLVSTEEDSDLSEAAMAYYTLLGLKDVTNDSDYNGMPGIEGDDYTILPNGDRDFGNVGGNQLEATLVASSYVGAVVEDNNTQYNNMANIKNNGLDKKYAFNSNDYEQLNVQYLNIADRDMIKQAIIDNGSVGIGYVEDRAEDICHQYNGEWYYYFPVNPVNANHAVNIVGWDDNVPKEYFHCPDFYNDPNKEMYPEKDGAWLIRNSWGKNTDMHKDGYFWMSYYDTCIESTAFSVEATYAGMYKYNYHYDTTASLNLVKIVSGGSVGNVFKVEGESGQMLQAVNVALDGSNMDFDIEVYTNSYKMSNPTDGIKESSKRVHKDVSGIYTIELDNAVALDDESYYSIVVINRSSEDIRVFADFSSEGGDRIYHNEVKLGQSFGSRRSSNFNWEDENYIYINSEDEIGSGFSYRIKGLANDGFCITFQSNDGLDKVFRQSADKDGITKLKKNRFKRLGYKFKYWEDDNYNHYDDMDEIMISHDITLKAIWEPITYTINYETYGGFVNPNFVTKTYDEPVTLHDPTRQYSHFIDWYEDEDYTQVYDGSSDLSTIEDDNVTIYAKYKGDEFDVYFITNGGAILTDNISKYEYGKDAYLPTNVRPNSDDENAGKKFYGWYDNAKFEGNKIYQINKTEFGTKTFYARYEKVRYITFDANGGYGYMPNQVVFEIDNTILVPNSFSKDKYSFVHWESNNGNIYDNALNIGHVTQDLNLRAIWEYQGRIGGSSGGGGGGGGLPTLQNGTGGQVNNLILQQNLLEVRTNGNNINWQQAANGSWQMMFVDNTGKQQLIKDTMVSIPIVVSINVNGLLSNIMVETKYYFDQNGNMYTGWLTASDGSKFFFNTDQGSEIGKMSVGWKQILGNYYYFGQDGKMLTNTTTPDGYIVGADGVWIK